MSDDRVENYYNDESAYDLAEWLVDAEDEIAVLKAKIARLEGERSG